MLRLVRGGGSQIRLGLLRLTDAAPMIVAKEFGFFEDEGLEVSLSVEPSWANIADKVSYGLLDGAIMLPPLVMAISLGLRGGAGLPLSVPMSLGLNGNTITFGNAFADALCAPGVGCDAMTIGRRLAVLLTDQPDRPRFGVVHPFSSHNLILRHWLAACGIDTERDIAFDVIPPPRMVEALRSGRIVGFCSGAPWGDIAERACIGRSLLTSSAVWHNHPEKVFAVGQRFAETDSVRLAALLRSLLRAARHCDDPVNAAAVATLVADRRYLDVEPDAVRSSLPGTGGPNESVFFRSAATFPWRSHARWFLAEMMRWGYLPRGLDAARAAHAIYRPDIYAAAAADIGVAVPDSDMKIEGAHAESWLLAASPSHIEMGTDLFCDGTIFDASAPAGGMRTAIQS
jgi:ABC-type nitrate/sulfonate/bicarbonate transport system substrate-binding protein